MPSNTNPDWGRQLNIEWGARLRKTREELGLSQMAVATKAGIDKGYYARIERGEVGGRGVGDEIRIRIARAVHCRVEQIFTYPDTTDQEAAPSTRGTAR